MKAKIKVRATDSSKPVLMPGKRVLVDGKDVRVIGIEVVEVPNDLYYRHRIKAGDLVLVEE
ncbi:MAG: DUF2635 domain-containing protein [Pseudomonadota bacterium]